MSVALVGLLSASVWGQQPKRKLEPWVAPLLPAEPAWTLTLPAQPSAGGAMDLARVYVPLMDPVVSPDEEPILTARTLSAPTTLPGVDGFEPIAVQPIVPSLPLTPPAAMIAAFNRETGTRAWTARVRIVWPLVAGAGVVYVAADTDVLALEASTGRTLWRLPLERAPRAPMLLEGNMLLVLTEPDELLGIRVDARAIAWRRPLAEQNSVRMTADDRAVYLATAGGRLICVRLHDGSVAWDQPLEGELSEPTVARDRVFVGSTSRAFWALDARTGKTKWKWDFRQFGGDVIGAAVDKDLVYVAALDDILRAFNVGNGNRRWKKVIGTRPVLPPSVFPGIVLVRGLTPTLSTFNTKTGALVSTWAAPEQTAELKGPPLIDPILRPFRVAIVNILSDGRVIALRPTAMMFAGPALTPLPALPGRPVPVESFPRR